MTKSTSSVSPAETQAENDAIDELTGEVGQTDADTVELFGDGPDREIDDVIQLPGTMTVASLGANPENGKNGKCRICRFSGVATNVRITKGEALGYDRDFEILEGSFVGVSYDQKGLEIVNKASAGTLAMPGGLQNMAIVNLEKSVERGGRMISFAIELWTGPAKNPTGYRWYAYNIAKLDRNNRSFAHRLLDATVAAPNPAIEGPGGNRIANG